MAPENRNQSYWQPDRQRNPASAPVYPPVNKRYTPPEREPSACQACRRQACGTSTATNFPDRTSAAARICASNTDTASTVPPATINGTAKEMPLRSACLSSVLTLFLFQYRRAHAAQRRQALTPARVLLTLQHGVVAPQRVRKRWGSRKAFTLFDRHFCGKDTCSGLLQLLRREASLNTVRPCFSTTTLTPILRPAFPVLRCHIGVGNPGRAGGNADNSRGTLGWRRPVPRVRRPARSAHLLPWSPPLRGPEIVIRRARRERR